MLTSVIRTEMLTSVINEETRPYLSNVFEPFNFSFVLLVIEKDISHHD